MAKAIETECGIDRNGQKTGELIPASQEHVTHQTDRRYASPCEVDLGTGKPIGHVGVIGKVLGVMRKVQEARGSIRNEQA